MDKHAAQTRRLLLAHCRQYPQLQAQDVCKFLYQSAFGCEHLLSSPEEAAARIREEYATVPPSTPPLVEMLDGAYCRVHLSCLHEGLTPDTLAAWFCRSAKHEAEGATALRRKLAVARELAAEGALPFSWEDFTAAVEDWEAAGFPAVRHSAHFRECYHPAYRVIAVEYAAKLMQRTNP